MWLIYIRYYCVGCGFPVLKAVGCTPEMAGLCTGCTGLRPLTRRLWVQQVAHSDF